jgi:hypothetical protein
VACGEVKPLEDFWTRKNALDGRSKTCASCLNVRRNAPDPEDVDRVERWKEAEVDWRAAVERARRELEG